MGKFEDQKKKAMLGLAQAREEGKADDDIADLVDMINKSDDFYTTSSCAGRVAVLQTPKKHDKLESKWLGKWHQEVAFDNLKEALEKHDKYVVYLQSECPILHVVARDCESAEKILFDAQQCGFKRSGIQAINPERVLVEICSTEMLEVPLAEDGKILVDDIYLSYLVNIANIKLRSGREKLDRLYKRLLGSLN